MTLLTGTGRVVLSSLVVLVVGYFCSRPFFRWIVSQNIMELLTPAALFYVLAIAWLSHFLGLSYGLGAFLAGISIADTRYSPMVQTEIHPFRILLLALFFLSAGLKVNPQILLEQAVPILLLTAIFVPLKFAANFGALWATSPDRGPAYRTGALLAQGSEFSLVLLMALQHLGVIGATEA
jgi:Kef-type K+ transport system membrane component KefB